MSNQLDKLTKKELLELIAQLQSAPEAVQAESTPEDPRDAEIQSLRDALAGAHRSNTALKTRIQHGGATKFAVVNIGGAAVAIYARDERGQRERFFFSKRDEVHYLTTDQITEVRRSHGWLFNDGLLHVPELQEENQNPNIIADYAAFIEDTDLNDLSERVALITSLHTLQALGQHIESERWQVVEEQGEEVLKPVKLAPRLAAIGQAITARIEEIESARRASIR